MADNRTPPMEQSAAAIVDMMHNISRDGLPQGPQLGTVPEAVQGPRTRKGAEAVS